MATLKPKRELTDAVGALPSALNPLALSLNENPFPPLPAVRSALIESIDAANRYPEFLPERLRSLIAGHVGVPRRAGGDRGRRHGGDPAGAACGHEPGREDR